MMLGTSSKAPQVAPELTSSSNNKTKNNKGINMNVKINATHVIKPSKPTWSGILQLSELDQIGALPYASAMYFYHNTTPKDWVDPTNNIINTIKHSLSQILVSYYPLAGRLCWRDDGIRFDLDCNAMGVEFIEAECTMDMSKFPDFVPSKTLEQLAPNVDYGKPIQDLPLFVAQLTRFPCGGFVLAIRMSHAIVDGGGAFTLFQDWAKVARGETLESLPILDRGFLLSGGNDKMAIEEENDDATELPKLVGKLDDFEERIKEVEVATLILTKDQVDRLRKMANSEKELNHGRMYSRFEIITAYIWKCACKARELEKGQQTGVNIIVNFRGCTNPPLPQRYFGNAVVDVISLSTNEELLSKSLSNTCRRIRHAKKKVDTQYVMRLITNLKTEDDLTKLQSQFDPNGKEGIFIGNPNLEVISWLNLPIYGLDFGWGKETYMRPGPHDNIYDGLVTIFPSSDDGSIVVVMGLQVRHMEKFKNFFYEDITRSNLDI